MKSDNLIKPIISERSFEEAKTNRYSFVVAPSATKSQIADAVEKLFKVKVLKVYTANVKKSKNIRTRFGIKKADATYKKARVQLLAGQKIAIFEEQTDDKKTKKGKK
jgi:large subunit ribosomal protein L23